jgi:hypothetical protein
MDVRCIVNTLGTFECFIEMNLHIREKKHLWWTSYGGGDIGFNLFITDHYFHKSLEKKVVKLHGFTNQNYVIYYIIMKFYILCHQTNNSWNYSHKHIYHMLYTKLTNLVSYYIMNYASNILTIHQFLRL